MRPTTGGRCHQHRGAGTSTTPEQPGLSASAAVDPMLADVPGPHHQSYLYNLKANWPVACSLPDCDNLGFRRTRNYGGEFETSGVADRCPSCRSAGRAVAPGDPGYDVLLALAEGHTRCIAQGCTAPTRSRSGRCHVHRDPDGPTRTDPGGLPQRSAHAERDILDPGEPRLIDLIGSFAGPQFGLAARGSDQHLRDIRDRHVDAWCIGGSDDDPCPNTTKSRSGRCGGHRPPAYGTICIGITASGQRCRRSVWGPPTCGQHRDGETVLTTDTHLCTAIAHSGKRCTKTVADGTVTCYLHSHWSNPNADRAGHLAGTPQANPDHDERVEHGIGRWRTRRTATPPTGRDGGPTGRGGRTGEPTRPRVGSAPREGFEYYAHANDAVVGPAAAKRNLPNVEHLRGRKVIFVDMDGTIYDSCASVGRKDKTLIGTPENRHIREDTVEAIKAQIEANTGPDGVPPVPVALTWRAGCEKVTRKWLGHGAELTGLEITDVFLPGSSQDIAGLALPRRQDGGMDHQANRKQWGGGQVAFKAAEIDSLIDVLGIVPVAHFEDNADVLKMSESKGTGHIHHVPRLVEIAPHEWAAGYLGAPKPAAASSRSWGGGGSTCESCANPFDGVNVRKSDRDLSRCTDCVATVGTWAEEQKSRRAARKAAAKDSGVGKARRITPTSNPFAPVPDDDYSAGNHCTSCGTPVGGHPDPWAVCSGCDHATTGADGAAIVEGSDLWLDTGGEMEEVTVMMADDGTDSVAVKRRSDGEMLFVDAEDLHSAPF